MIRLAAVIDVRCRCASRGSDSPVGMTQAGRFVFIA